MTDVISTFSAKHQRVSGEKKMLAHFPSYSTIFYISIFGRFRLLLLKNTEQETVTAVELTAKGWGLVGVVP